MPSIRVLREGLFGSATVDIRSGFPSGTFGGFAAGKVLPASQLLSFTGSKNNDSISVQVSPCEKSLILNPEHGSCYVPIYVSGSRLRPTLLN